MLTLQDILSSPKQYFSIAQVTEALGVARQTIDYHLNQGNIDYIEVGFYRAISGESVAKYLKEKKGFKSLKEILAFYKLPYKRDEK